MIGPTRRPRLLVLLLVLMVVLAARACSQPGCSARPCPRCRTHRRHRRAEPRHGGAARRAGRRPAPWVWPTGSRVVDRPWEAPDGDYGPGHRGIDVAAALGTPAVAVDDGTVTFAGQVAGRGVVTIDHGSGLVSTLDSVVPTVAAGQVVTRDRSSAPSRSGTARRVLRACTSALGSTTGTSIRCRTCPVPSGRCCCRTPTGRDERRNGVGSGLRCAVGSGRDERCAQAPGWAVR